MIEEFNLDGGKKNFIYQRCPIMTELDTKIAELLTQTNLLYRKIAKLNPLSIGDYVHLDEQRFGRIHYIGPMKHLKKSSKFSKICYY